MKINGELKIFNLREGYKIITLFINGITAGSLKVSEFKIRNNDGTAVLELYLDGYFTGGLIFDSLEVKCID